MTEWATLADRVLKATNRVFGENVTHVQGMQTLREIFDEAHEIVSIADGVPVSSVAPVLGVRLADFNQKPDFGDTFTIRGKGYRVVDIKPDGHGGAELILEKVM